MTDELNENTSLGQIAAAAAADPDLNPPEPPKLDEQGKPIEPIDYNKEAGIIVNFGSKLFLMAFPRLNKIWTPQVLADTQEAIAGLFAHYKMGSLKFLENPWIGLAIVTVPIAYPTYQAIKADLSDMDKIEEVVINQPSGSMSPVLDTSNPEDLFNKV